MLADLSVEKLFVLALVGLFVLGPERLPAAVSWLVGAVRRVRRVVDDTQRSLQRDLGPEFDQLRAPLRELREPLEQFRDLSRPGRALGRYLTTPAEPALPDPPAARPAAAADPAAAGLGERIPAGSAPFDPDAT